VDVNDVMWIANEQSAGSVNNGGGSITLLNDAGASTGNYVTGGIFFPVFVAFDTSGVAWVVDYGNSSLTLLSANGTALSGTAGYSSANIGSPVAVATDAKCNAYVANEEKYTVTLVTADGSSYTDYTVGDEPSGIAIDASGNVWTANLQDNSVGLVSGGSVLSGSGFTGGGMDHPQGIAADGVGNVWVASNDAPGLTELAGAAATTPGVILSPSAGFGADSGMSKSLALAIDASGNVWVTNMGTNTLTEFVGIAAPVQTPLLGPVRVP
jgi:streptogramin lyase